jgi:hypothetical protein
MSGEISPIVNCPLKISVLLPVSVSVSEEPSTLAQAKSDASRSTLGIISVTLTITVSPGSYSDLSSDKMGSAVGVTSETSLNFISLGENGGADFVHIKANPVSIDTIANRDNIIVNITKICKVFEAIFTYICNL